MLEDSREVKKEIVSDFERLYTKTEEWRPHLQIENCSKISDRENLLLMVPFESRRFWMTLKLVHGTRQFDLVDTLWSSLSSVGKLSEWSL